MSDDFKRLGDSVGETHTVEVHPHIDHLYRVKGYLKSQGGSAHISNIKKQGFPSNIVENLPKDAKGRVSTEAIDNHIESLPKTKVDITVHSYDGWGGQQVHRHGVPQYVLAARMHPEHAEQMDKPTANLWDQVKHVQHKVTPNTGEDNVMGWIRVDPHKSTPSSAPSDPDSNNYPQQQFAEEGNWHLDEIQSDFQNLKKITNAASYKNPNSISKEDATPERLLEHLSAGFDDPQGLLHSAAHQLARKFNVKSATMDTLPDQVKQSNLQTTPTGFYRTRYIRPNFNPVEFLRGRIRAGSIADSEKKEEGWNTVGKKMASEYAEDFPEFSSAVEKLGGEEGIKRFAGIAHHVDNNNTGVFSGHGDFTKGPAEHMKDLHDGLKSLTDNEKQELSSFLGEYQHEAARRLLPNDLKNGENEHTLLHDRLEREHEASEDQRLLEFQGEDGKPREIPVHIKTTYSKRPKKMGYQEIDKGSILGENQSDPAKKVQYTVLHKNLIAIRDLLRKIRDGKTN